MPAPSTVEEFLEVLGKSGLADMGRVQSFREQPGADTPRKLAGLLVGAGLLTQFQAEQVLQGKHRGYTIGKYKVLERIGCGGNGTVYLCEHVVVRRRVAIKVLPLCRAENPSALARFYREARAAGALDHPNLVKAHDVDEDGGLHFLVMDYVEGPSLQEIVARFGPLSVERSAHYIRQAALGLEAAHAAGLVHRDIKPANILVDRSGTVRVLDLGLARFFSDQDDPLTLKYDNNSVLGTADYLSPEQALNSHDVDGRADIYSLGATFYFLLTGRTLFPDGKITQKLIWHQTRQPTPLRQLRPEVPAELAAVVERMLAKDPEKRYQTPAELIEALKPSTATPIPPPPEAEMPRLSPAARAAAMADVDGGPSTARGGRSGNLAPRPSAQPASSSGRGRQAVRPPKQPAAMADVPTISTRGAQVETAAATRPSPAPALRPSAHLPSPAVATPPAATVPPASQAERGSRWLLVSLLLLLGIAAGLGLRWLAGW